MAAGVDNLLKIDDEIRARDAKVRRECSANLSEKQFKAGELMFEAYMRMLDSRVSCDLTWDVVLYLSVYQLFH